MLGRKELGISIVLVGMVCQAFAGPSIFAQGLHDILRAQARVFPAVGPGVEALTRDSSGRYYILAEPAKAILVYSATGQLIGQIPNANSRGATIRYAVSIDLDSQGRLFVADRGANAIKIFAPDGSPVATVPVTAPTSVVALSGGQFAVTQLQSKRLVQIMDESGATIRAFGDPADQPGARPAAQPVTDRGRITGDSKGNIYFAFTSLPDPTLQRFDRFGYSAYDAVIPAATFGPLAGRTGREVDLGYKISGLGGPTTVTAWTDLHSLPSLSMAAGARRGLRGQSTGASAANADQSALPGDVLAFDADNSSDSLSDDSSLFSANDLDMFRQAWSGGLVMPGVFGGFGGGFHEGMRGMFGGGGGEGPRPEFARRTGVEGFGHHPGMETYSATATVRIALDDPSRRAPEKLIITAVGVDPETQEAWAAISDTLVHFDSNGNRLDTWYLATPNGASMKPTSILVEPNRILIASDLWGIFEFPRPDKPSPPSQNTIVPQQMSPTRPPPPK